MGRPERPLDPGAGPLARFAADLRLLRQRAGGRSYRELARRAHYSATTLAQAAAGQQLPSLEVTLAYVTACGGDRGEWEARWRALNAELRERGERRDAPDPPTGAGSAPAQRTGTAAVAGPAEPDAPASAAGPADPERTPRSRRRLSRVTAFVAPVLVGVVAFAAGREGGMSAGRAGAARTLREARAATSVAARAATQPPAPHDGGDPVLAGCAADAVTLASSPLVLRAPVRFGPRVLDRGTTLGTVLLRYSAHCAAAWAKLVPSNAITQADYATIAVSVVRPADGTGATFRVGHLVDAYTDILTTEQGCAYAQATITGDAGHASTATTACRVD